MEDLITEAAPSVLGANYSPSSGDFFFVFVNAVSSLKWEVQIGLCQNEPSVAIVLSYSKLPDTIFQSYVV